MGTFVAGQAVGRLLVLASILALAACSPRGDAAQASAEVPTATPSPTPSPSPTSTEITQGSFIRVCHGDPVPGAATYSGKTHPLVVIAKGGVWSSVAIDKNWLDHKWKSSQIQLVICDTDMATEKDLKPCRYQKIGNVRRTQALEQVEVRLAKTGELLQRGAVAGPVSKCPDLVMLGPGDYLPGELPTAAQFNAYANTVYNQKVRPTPKPTPTAQPTPTDSYDIIP